MASNTLHSAAPYQLKTSGFHCHTDRLEPQDMAFVVVQAVRTVIRGLVLAKIVLLTDDTQRFLVLAADVKRTVGLAAGHPYRGSAP